ncbi:unnamed protein product [Taenia asiatica]|uniref:Sulfatase domain-containing protein n=1 Tax=Taenia asiatica TaxID=60517 RepID=A0A0R3WFB4_TAEAS|nr:unnamed protein product [Taenia asiatica]
MGDPLFCGNSEIDILFHTFLMKGIPTEATWSDVTKLPCYNPGWDPSYHVNRLCSQEKIMREIDARGLALLTVSVARGKFIKGKLGKSKTEESPTDNRIVNRSTAKRFNIVFIINLTAHSSLLFY